MKIRLLLGTIERAFRRFWRRYIHDAMPPPPDPKQVVGLLKLGLQENGVLVLEKSEAHGEYVCGCTWAGQSIPHYCPRHPWACPLFVIA